MLLPLQWPIDFQYLMMFVHAVMEDQYPRGVFPLEGETCTCSRVSSHPPGTPKAACSIRALTFAMGDAAQSPGLPWHPGTAGCGRCAVPCRAVPCSALRSWLEGSVGQRGNIFLRCLISSRHGSWRLISVEEE